MAKKKQDKASTIFDMIHRKRVRDLAYDMFPDFDFNIKDRIQIDYTSELKRLKKSFLHDLCYIIEDTLEIQMRLKEIENIVCMQKEEKKKESEYLRLCTKYAQESQDKKEAQKALVVKKAENVLSAEQGLLLSFISSKRAEVGAKKDQDEDIEEGEKENQYIDQGEPHIAKRAKEVREAHQALIEQKELLALIVQKEEASKN